MEGALPLVHVLAAAGRVCRGYGSAWWTTLQLWKSLIVMVNTAVIPRTDVSNGSARLP